MNKEEIDLLKNKIDFSAMFADDLNIMLGFDAARKLIEYYENLLAKEEDDA